MSEDREYSLCFSFQPCNRIAESRTEITRRVSRDSRRETELPERFVRARLEFRRRKSQLLRRIFEHDLDRLRRLIRLETDAVEPGRAEMFNERGVVQRRTPERDEESVFPQTREPLRFPAESIRSINVPVKKQGFLSRLFSALSLVELSFVPEGGGNPVDLYFESITPVKDAGLYEAAKNLARASTDGV